MKAYNPKSYELAIDVLFDYPELDNTENRDELASEIQETIENWIEDNTNET